MQKNSASLAKALRDVSACRVCAAELPLGPRPVVQLGSGARLLIVGQAPGRKVHLTGVPWNDASGDRLREWLGLDRDTFFDATKIALLPMGFCYPGVGSRAETIRRGRNARPIGTNDCSGICPRFS